MPNAVDTGEFAPCDAKRRGQLRQRFGIPISAQVVIFVGRLAPEKELQSLIQTFAASLCDERDAVLLLVGDGAVWDELEALAAELRLGAAVRFVGRKTAGEVALWLQASVMSNK